MTWLRTGAELCSAGVRGYVSKGSGEIPKRDATPGTQHFISASTPRRLTDRPDAIRGTATPRWRSLAGFLLLRGPRRGRCRTIARLVRIRTLLARWILQ